MDLLARGDTASAVRQLERVDLETREDPRLYIILGSLYREMGTIRGRLRSQLLLERANQLFPHNPGVMVELGKTYFSQTFFPDAMRYFSAALKLDGDLCEAHYYLGLHHYNTWKRVNEYTDNLAIARRHFYKSVRCDSTDVNSTIKYLYCLYALNEREMAAAACDQAVRRLGDVPEFVMLRAALAYDDERYDDAQEDFTHGLTLFGDGERRAYSNILQMLPYDDRSMYKSSSPAKRQVIERTYWTELDPDPTTPINERHLEHIYRMFLADLYFSLTRPPIRGWNTERGATFVKFGWPWKITSTLGNSWMSGRTESWYYLGRNGVREFVFVDEYLNGNLRIPLAADSMVSVLRYEPRASNYESVSIPVPGGMDVTTFKDDDMSSSVYVSIMVDADSLRNVVNLEKVNHFHFRGSFFNETWLAEKDFADTLWTSDVYTSHEEGRCSYHLIRSVVMPFDYYNFACSFEDEFGLVTSLFKTHSDTYRYAGDGLAVSDIMLQNDTRPEAVHFERNGRRLYPNTDRRYAGGQRLATYFEIYNLRTTDRYNDYDVSFHIYDAPLEINSAWRKLGRWVASVTGLNDDKTPTISQTVHRRSEGFSSSEEIAINIDSLEGGRYELVVTVEDRISGDNARSSVIFFKTAQAR